jgi:hypothetical protein
MLADRFDINFVTSLSLSLSLSRARTHTHTHTQAASTPENEKALLQAAKDGDTHKVASLIEAGTDPMCTDEVRV